jgi:hypothetical protein
METLMLTQADIKRYVRHEEWQTFRASLKGRTTQNKLVRLQYWLGHDCTFAREVQTLNYLNALARGGQIKPVPQVMGIELMTLFIDNEIRINR